MARYAPEKITIVDEEPPRTGQAESAKQVSFVESLPVFIERVLNLPPVKALVNELILEDTIGLSHGQPRDGKSLAEIELLLALSTGTNAFGLDRFAVPHPLKVCYLTEEDGERWVLERLQQLLKGRKLSSAPSEFFLSVQKGINLDDYQWQANLIRETKQRGFAVVSIDPLRAFTGHADQGPNEFKPLADFLRRFQPTGCVPRIVHHDTKPMVGKPDDRKRPQRASGGGVFSVANCTLSFERISEIRNDSVPRRVQIRPHSETLYRQIDGDG